MSQVTEISSRSKSAKFLRMPMIILFIWSLHYCLICTTSLFTFIIALLYYVMQLRPSVEAIFRGISRPLQHSSVWLLYYLISNGLSLMQLPFLYFGSWLITTITSTTTTTTTTTSSLATFLLKVQAYGPSNHCQTVNYANVMSCAIHIRPKCDCAPNCLIYFPSRHFSSLILTDYS